jgi:hypothetical protein
MKDVADIMNHHGSVKVHAGGEIALHIGDSVPNRREGLGLFWQVKGYHPLSPLKQGGDKIGADEPSGSGYQNCHSHLPFLIFLKKPSLNKSQTI